MKIFLTITFAVFSLAMFGISALMNYKFGTTFGITEFDQQVYGAASVVGDCLKALCAFAVVFFIARKQRFGALLAMGLLAVTFAYSLASSIGFAAQNRGGAVAAKTITAERQKNEKSELEKVNKQLDSYPKHRSAAVLEYLIAREGLISIRHKKNVPGRKKPKWVTESLADATNNCGLTNWAAQKYCGPVLRLQEEAALAAERQKLEARRDYLNERLAGGVVPDADPQATFISDLSGKGKAAVATMLTLLLTLLVEAGASISFYLIGCLAVGGPGRPALKAANSNKPPVASQTACKAMPHAEKRVIFNEWLEGLSWYDPDDARGRHPVFSTELCRAFEDMTGCQLKPNVFGQLMADACPANARIKLPGGTAYCCADPREVAAKAA